MVVKNDTIPMVQLEQAEVEGKLGWKARRYRKRFDKLTRNVVKVYPYAKIASELLDEYNRDLQRISSEGKQKEYMKIAEAELKAEFEGEIRNMTFSQGIALIKLIDRETGDTSYELIKELKGSFSAFVWQTLAKLFGHDLRTRYEPKGEDALMERVVRRIENGDLPVAQRKPMTAKARKRLERRKKRIYKKYGLDELRTSTSLND